MTAFYRSAGGVSLECRPQGAGPPEGSGMEFRQAQRGAPSTRTLACNRPCRGHAGALPRGSPWRVRRTPKGWRPPSATLRRSNRVLWSCRAPSNPTPVVRHHRSRGRDAGHGADSTALGVSSRDQARVGRGGLAAAASNLRHSTLGIVTLALPWTVSQSWGSALKRRRALGSPRGWR